MARGDCRVDVPDARRCSAAFHLLRGFRQAVAMLRITVQMALLTRFTASHRGRLHARAGWRTTTSDESASQRGASAGHTCARSRCVVRPWLLRSLFRSCSPTAMRLACSTAAQPLEAAVDVRAFPAPALNPRRATSPARQHAARVRKGPMAHACCRSLRSFTQVALLWGSSADACAAPAAARPR